MARRRVAAAGGTVVLDCEGVAKVAARDVRAQAYLEKAHAQCFRVVIAAVTLAEVLRGGAREVNVNRVIAGVAEVVPVTEEIAREAAHLLKASGLDGHRCAIDAMVAAVARRQRRPVVLLTSDPEDMKALTEEPERPKSERITVVKV